MSSYSLVPLALLGDCTADPARSGIAQLIPLAALGDCTADGSWLITGKSS
jgi:hypothetical protein